MQSNSFIHIYILFILKTIALIGFILYYYSYNKVQYSTEVWEKGETSKFQIYKVCDFGLWKYLHFT